MRILNISASLLVLLCGITSCGPSTDPELKPYVRIKNEKDAKPFLQKPFEEQVEIYLKVAALPLKPPDYSLGGVIAHSDGDIGERLAERIRREGDIHRIEDLVRLAGQYCYLNRSCEGQYTLDDAVDSGVEKIPNWRQNSYISQNVTWVSDRVRKKTGP